jgi:serine/threonine-protein kinase
MTAGASGAAAPAPDQAEAAAAAPPRGRVESSELVPAAGATFDAAVLTRIEGALAESIGPLARLLVRKAAKSAPDLPELCQALEVALPEVQRAAFRRRLGSIGGPPPTPPAPPAGPGAAVPRAETAPGQPLSPEVLAEASDRLAVHIGPVAKLLVKRAAKEASSTKDLYERLAAHIDDPRDRRRFRAGIEELSEP